MPQDTVTLLTYLIVGALPILYVFACVATAKHSWNKYKYKVYLNKINLAYLLYFPLAFISAFTEGSSQSYQAIMTVLFLSPITFVGFHNIKNTSVIFGLWVTLVQASTLLVIIVLLGGARRKPSGMPRADHQ